MTTIQNKLPLYLSHDRHIPIVIYKVDKITISLDRNDNLVKSGNWIVSWLIWTRLKMFELLNIAISNLGIKNNKNIEWPRPISQNDFQSFIFPL